METVVIAFAIIIAFFLGQSVSRPEINYTSGVVKKRGRPVGSRTSPKKKRKYVKSGKYSKKNKPL